MIRKYLLIIVLIISCNTNSSNTKEIIGKNDIIKFVKKQINTKEEYKYILLISENSCGKCRSYLFENIDKLLINKNLLIVYLFDTKTSLPIEIRNKVKLMQLEKVERRYDFFGIELYYMNNENIIRKQNVYPDDIYDVVAFLIKTS